MTTQSTYSIRTARPSDIPLLGAIERSAGQLFRTVGLDSIADDEPMPVEVLQSYLQAANLWVAEVVPQRTPKVSNSIQTRSQKHGTVVAFLAAFPIHRDDSSTPREDATNSVVLHIAELSVHADYQRKGLATRLIEELVNHAEQLARSQGQEGAVTESASATLPWTCPVGLSLTTYKDIAFNAPFYARLGFEIVQSGDIERVVGKRARELWDEEQARVAWREGRVWMVRWL